jgi:hypothetical protein
MLREMRGYVVELQESHESSMREQEQAMCRLKERLAETARQLHGLEEKVGERERPLGKLDMEIAALSGRLVSMLKGIK